MISEDSHASQVTPVELQDNSNKLPTHNQSEYFISSEDSMDNSPMHLSEKRKVQFQDNTGRNGVGTRSANFLWGVWYYHNEATFLFPENDYESFPKDNSLVVSPQTWKVIKLCGRPIAFHETGVVSAMSQVDSNTPSLNISTALTNCTLVPFDLLGETVSGLSRALSCPVCHSVPTSP
jgi:hypothetical protein